jgi:hypothetical protein
MRTQPPKIPMKRRLLAASILALGFAADPSIAAHWSFGVISDTQWTIADDGKNPNTCAADIIRQIDQQFIDKGVELVVHVGDMVNSGSQDNDYTRALYAQDLYNAGIGFYPLRGNHEAAHDGYVGSGADYKYAYPQIVPGSDAGVNNATPDDITTALIPEPDLHPDTGNPPADKTNPETFIIGTDFSAPDGINSLTGGVSYAFQYKNVTFLLLDQFKSPDYYPSYIPEQQPWINDTLSNRPAGTHAFAFTHKNILGGNHKDSMFGGQANGNDPGDGYYLCDSEGNRAAEGNTCVIDPETSIPSGNPNVDTLIEKQEAEDAFLVSLQENNVRYVISGHDHHHYNSVVTSPLSTSKVHQLITQSDSSKFYTPKVPVSPNDTPIEQDLGWVGYYIFTVDGPRVTIDYYADTTHDSSWIAEKTTPTLSFVKRSTTGYSLNGKENLVPQGGSYAMTDDTDIAATMESGFLGTSMAILDGTNASTAETNYGRATEKAVNSGWAPAQANLASDILTLWGMTDVGTDETDTYVLSMSFDKQAPRQQLGNGGFGIATKDANGNWVNAVNRNVKGDTKLFVKGGWKPGYELGTYGVDASTKTAWAVINHAGEFAVTTGIEAAPGHRK